jgi:hypothetical protein
MRKANVPGLIDAVLAETIPMHGRMIHGQKQGKFFEESQAYDIHGRVCLHYEFIRYCRQLIMLVHSSS